MDRDQFERSILDLGLSRPWYWDSFIRSLDVYGHADHLGVWYWRPTVWWNVPAGVSPEERNWLEEKYPGWNDTWGGCWDVIIENALADKQDKLLPATLPVICNLCCIPITGTPGAGWQTNTGVRDFHHDVPGRRYHFCSNECRWIFQTDPERYGGHTSVVDRFLMGQIQPPDLFGALAYMNLAPGEFGVDATDMAWVEAYRQRVGAGR